MQVVRPVLARCQRTFGEPLVVRQWSTNWFAVCHVHAPHQRDGWRADDGGALSVVVYDTPSVGAGTVDAGWFPL